MIWKGIKDPRCLNKNCSPKANQESSTANANLLDSGSRKIHVSAWTPRHTHRSFTLLQSPVHPAHDDARRSPEALLCNDEMAFKPFDFSWPQGTATSVPPLHSHQWQFWSMSISQEVSCLGQRPHPFLGYGSIPAPGHENHIPSSRAALPPPASSSKAQQFRWGSLWCVAA